MADEVEITLIDKNDSFIFGFSKLDVMFGRREIEQVKSHYADVLEPSVQFRQEAIHSIDAVERTVVTDVSTYYPDILVVALGADSTSRPHPVWLREGTSSTRLKALSVSGRHWRSSPAARWSSVSSGRSSSARGLRMRLRS